jgi:exodeoxyribonuclease III
MLIATWNVNSIRARIDRVTAWLSAKQPDVLCMQELKVEEKDLPVDAFAALGYQSAHACQKTYNGVAILAKRPIENVLCGLSDGAEDNQQRLIAGTVDGIRILSVYVPNGQSVGSEKWNYKLEWMSRLREYLEKHCDKNAPLILCGDFNVAPEARDVHDPMEWEPTTLFHIDARTALERVRSWGLYDAFRLHHQDPGFYSWWDYRMLGFPKNRGLRIDHLFITEPLIARCKDSWIDREARKGKQPSDHAPVLASFS